jgi:ubiquinone/menaquinone biosynthesis C-methylase UbiE
VRAGHDALFDRVGIREGARCVDVGCGGGHVSRELARRVGASGSVVGIDLDAALLELASADVSVAGITNIEFRCGDATQLEGLGYDVAYARCLLSHVADPDAVVASIARGMKLGGMVIVEDIDFTGCFCYPPCSAHDRYVELYRETVRRRGGNADLGPALPACLRRARLEDVGVAVSQASALEGDAKLIPPLTLERIADAVVGE